MILKKSHTEIDKNKWDECITASQFPIIYGYSWYLDAVSPNWAALVIESDNKYDAVFPLTEKKKLGFRYLAQPFFCQQLGLFHRLHKPTGIESFIKKIQNEYSHYDITLNETNPITGNYKPRINLVLNLNNEYEFLKKGYSKNRKRDLNKTKKGDISFSESSEISDFINFFWKQKGNQIEDLTQDNYKVINAIFNNAKESSCNKLLFGSNDKGELISASYFLIINNRIIFLLGASNEEGKKKGVMTSMFDLIIKQYSGQNMTLDFEGSNIEGVAKFYKSLGGKEKKYISLKGNSFLWNVIAPRIARLIQR